MTSYAYYSVKVDELPLDLRQMAMAVRDIEQKIQSLKKYFETTEKQLRTEIQEIQKACPHPRGYVEYYPDASGNNDSTDECTICGKSARSL